MKRGCAPSLGFAFSPSGLKRKVIDGLESRWSRPSYYSLMRAQRAARASQTCVLGSSFGAGVPCSDNDLKFGAQARSKTLQPVEASFCYAPSSIVPEVPANPQEAPQLSPPTSPPSCAASTWNSDLNQCATSALVEMECQSLLTWGPGSGHVLSGPGLRIGLAVSAYGQAVCVAFSPSWLGFGMVLAVVIALVFVSEPEFCQRNLSGSVAEKSRYSKTGEEHYFEIDDDKQGQLPCLRKMSRNGVCNKTVSFNEVVIELDLESTEEPVLIPLSKPSQDTRLTYTMAACRTRVAPKTYYGQEDRWLTDTLARYDPDEPDALREMVESGIYNAWELATAYRKAAGGAHPNDEAAKLVRQMYWRQYTQVLRPLLDRQYCGRC